MSRTPADDIIRTLSELQHTGRRTGQIFEDFIECSYRTLRSLPSHVRSVIKSGKLAKDEGEDAEYFLRIHDIYGDDWTVMRRAFALLLDSTTTEAGEMTYLDVVGDVFEQWDLGSQFRGQFFTPQSLCRAIAIVTAADTAEIVRTRVLEAVSTVDVGVRAFELLELEITDGILSGLWAEHRHKLTVEPVTIYDPACGSFRLPMAVAEQVPRWMVEHALVRFYGQDVDRLCWMMARINEMLYGLNGTGLWLQFTDAEPYREHVGEQIEIEREGREVRTTEHGQLEMII